MDGQDDDIHPHCNTCINVKKCNGVPKPGNSCELIPCHLDCGYVFHACKKREHKLLCLNEKVPCYNKEAGCPCVMQRGLLAKHLSTCPASVIHCTMEWNRWHINEVSEKKLLRCKRGLEQQDEQPQLDVALALRDQRLLRQWYSSSKSAQIALQNNFKKQPKNLISRIKLKLHKSQIGMAHVRVLDLKTKKTKIDYYKMCFSNDKVIRKDGHNPETCSGEILNASSLSHNAEIPGLMRSVCNQLCQAYECCVNNFNVTLLRRSGANQVISNKFASIHKYEDENKENMMNNRCLGECSNCSNIDDSSEQLEQALNSGKFSSDQINIEKVLRIKDDSDMFFFDEHVVSAIVPHPTRYLGLNSNVEVHGRSLIKEMYTFLCCQEFRRDEYVWHYKNVHCEIHGGLNGWLQERCPLAQYGCTFSRQRLQPMPKGSKLVYNEVLESFGVVPPSPECLNLPITLPSENDEDSGVQARMVVTSITQLPFEVLRHIASFLDSFSLSNLSLTCNLLRDVSQSLLVNRGIVTLHWERRKEGDSYKWDVVNKRWYFSTHFTPVKDWCFDDSNSMSNHLKTCMYFNKKKNLEPYSHVMGLIAPDSPLYQKLTRSLEAMKSGPESVTTKL